MSLWATLLETAIHSPSPHNVQPWRVRIHNDTEADLLIDSARTLPKEDPTGSFIILTMGMFIEALSLLAANQKHKLSHDLFHEPEWYAQAILEAREQTFLPFARLRLAPDDGLSNTNYDPAIFLKRRTARISLLPRPSQIIPRLCFWCLHLNAQHASARFRIGQRLKLLVIAISILVVVTFS